MAVAMIRSASRFLAGALLLASWRVARSSHMGYPSQLPSPPPAAQQEPSAVCAEMQVRINLWSARWPFREATHTRPAVYCYMLDSSHPDVASRHSPCEQYYLASYEHA